ncbi:hypothetical protein ADIS_4262 [Lunatimonas lonarensis]|uniref:Uncharacterized protein n=1 Tax=Lunatimonas lonarensis TaxID=1232681 RepID=R7ZLX5_9BACT|nr:hypothetical protein ADIS_4262 [Lunatimonas lonarensis]
MAEWISRNGSYEWDEQNPILPCGMPTNDLGAAIGWIWSNINLFPQKDARADTP